METRLSTRSKLIAFWTFVIIVLVAIAQFLSVLSPFLWALITAYIVTPVITLVTRITHLPRILVAVVAYLAIAALLIFGIVNLAPVVQQQGQALINQLPQTTEAGLDYFYEHLPHLARQLTLVGIDRITLERGINDLINQITSHAPLTAITVAQELFHFILELFVYLMATFFFFVHGDRFVKRLREAVPLRYQREAYRVFGEINATMGAYLRGQVVLVFIMSGLTYVALTILDMPYAIALAIATGCLELIPIVGPWSAGAIAVTVAALDPTPPFGWSNITLAVVVAVTYLTLRQLEDILVIPTLIGRIIHLHPLLVIFFLLIGTSLGGILGLLLAVPTAAVLRILVRYLYDKLIAEKERRVITIDEHGDLLDLHDEMVTLTNIDIVLLIQPEILTWNDLSTAETLATLAVQHGVDLAVVTTDPVAGSLFTAVGVATNVIGTATNASEAAPALPHQKAIPS